jgi:flagellin-like protein
MTRFERGSRGKGEQRAVSPVVATVLLVAIVVVLAATIGAYALEFGDDPATRQPNVDFTFEFNDSDDTAEDSLDIVHASGETVYVGDAAESGTVAAGDLYIIADQPYEDDTIDGDGDGFECGSPSGGQYECSFNFDNDFRVPGETMSAGERFRIYAAEQSTPFERATVTIVYRPEDGTRSYVLAEWTGPDA